MIDIKELEIALEFSDNIVVLTDEKGTIKYVNKAFANRYGYAKDTVVGKSHSLLNSGVHDEAFYSTMWDTLIHGETFKGYFYNKAKDDRIVVVQSTISPVMNSDGDVTGYIGVSDDVTAQFFQDRDAEQDKILLDRLFNSAPVAILILQPIQKTDVSDLLILKANPLVGSLVKTLGVVGLPISKVMPGFDVTAEKITVMLRERLTFELYLTELDVVLKFISLPIGENQICLFSYDVTAYRKNITALEESEERYFSLVEDAPVIICRYDLKKNLTYVNSQFCSYFNVDQDVLIGRPFGSVMSSGEQARMLSYVSKLSLEKPINSLILKGTDDVGVVRWQRWVNRALLDSEGNVFEYQSVGMDFTKQKQAEIALEEHRNKLDAIINNSVVGIMVLDLNGVIKIINAKWHSMLGLQKDSTAINVFDVIHEDFKDLIKVKHHQLIHSEISEYHVELKFLRSDGTDFWGDFYVSPMATENNKVNEIIGVVADITYKKEIELQLQKSERELKSLNATKDKLFSIISHDLKNPFNAILGFAKLLNENIELYSPEEIKEFTGYILEAGENTYKLMEDLLTWSKSQLGQIHEVPQQLSLSDVVDVTFSTLAILANSKKIKLKNEFSEVHYVWADYEMVKFVIRNLVHNAIKFTPVGGTITCLPINNNQEDEMIGVCVKDTGIGIHSDKVDVLFDMEDFFSTNGTAEEKGTGLGLHLSKEMVLKNKGIIEVSSVVGEGTEFSVYLPKMK